MKENCDIYREFAEKLRAAERVLLLPHVHMDGDAIGSAAALCLGLRGLGREAWILTAEETPENLAFLEYSCVTQDAAVFPEGSYLALMVDCGTMNRIPGREKAFYKAAARAVLDHHGVSGEQPSFDFGLTEPDSAACGELVWLVLEALGAEIDLRIANALFAAITTDTGNFQHSNTTKRSHEIMTRLYEVPGFNAKPVSSLIYDCNSFALLKLESRVVDQLRLYSGGKIGIGRVTQQMLRETGCRMDETDGFVQKIMSIRGIEAACMLKESEPEVIRVSLRARAYMNVADVAAQLGGGGHIRAAGATYHGTMEAAEETLAELLIREEMRHEES
ncbi:MAG: bifunctional oligoribonuclease/PAP phosphatase NrnA [Mogibacterium sp.]|nr:bifunctional oligoribonuclease/PAP phosphatase NrnA [Mogibacterium sp.]